MSISPRVLLLGGHGKVALYLTPLLLSRGWNVTSLVRNPEHRQEILGLQKREHKGKVDVLVSSLEEVKSNAAAQAILDRVQPDYVVWSAGAGGKGGPERTIAIDEVAAKHFISASFSFPRISKFLLVSYNGSRRYRGPWMSDEDWQSVVHANEKVLPTYAKAKIEADEFMIAQTAWRRRQTNLPQHFQSICLRPGYLTDEPGTGKVALGKITTRGTVPREDVAVVADRLLARDDTHGWFDLLAGNEPIDEAIDRVVRNKEDTIEGEDVEGIIARYKL